MGDQIEKANRETASHEGDRGHPMKDRGKNKVEKVPKKKIILCHRKGWVDGHPTTLLRSLCWGGIDLLRARGAQKRPTIIEP